MDKPHVLVIEDDASVSELLLACLGKEGYRVSIAQTGEAAFSQIEEDPPEVVVLDLNLPGMNGLDVCRTIRQDVWMGKIPVLMLTGKVEEDDIVAGLEVGADDYMTKPFSPKLLSARVMALLRRGKNISSGLQQKPEVDLDAEPETLFIKTLGKCEFLIDGQSLSWAEEFSPAQRKLMAMLVGAPDGKVSQEEIQTELWPESPSKKARSSFDSLLSRVRRTLDTALAPFDSKKYLIVKRGYLCLEHVRIDVQEFKRLIRKAGQQIAALEYWPAEITFSSAFSLWQGTFIPGSFGIDVAVYQQDELEQVFIDASQTFARLLADNKRYQQATKLLRDALRYDPTNDGLIRLLYQLSLAQESPGQASQVLKNYSESLTRENFSVSEIEEITEDLKKTVAPSGWLNDG
jgi:two-component system phosphate regulon response regulator PhoB